MRTEVLIRALQQDTRKNLGRAARFLGRAVVDSSAAELAELREGLVQVAPQSESYEAGYLRALADVAAARERLAASSESVASIVKGLSRQRQDVLRALGEGPTLVSELAAALGKTEGALSKLLSSLREDGLVEVTTSEGDRRARPQRLTSLGRRVHQALPPADRVSGVVKSTVEASVLAMASLVQAREEQRSNTEHLLESMLTHQLRAPLLHLVLESARHFGLVLEHGSRLVALPTLERRLADHLRSAARVDGLAGIFGEHWQRIPHGATLVVRARGRDVPAWRELASTVQDSPFASFRLMDDNSPEPLDPSIQKDKLVLLYDGITTAHADLKARTDFTRRTSHRFCMVAKGQEAPRDFHPLDFEAS